MARKRRRRYGGLVSLPSLSGLKSTAKEFSPLNKSVNSTDVLVGAGVGIVGGALVKIGMEKLDTALGGKLPDFVKQYAGPISAFLAGAGAYYFQRKSKKSRGTGHLVGASIAAILPIAQGLATAYLPFGSLVDVNLGLPIDDGVGMMIDEGMGDLGSLAAYSMNDEEDVLEAA
jgi:hypothetical protein